MFTRVVYGDAVIFSGNDVKALKQNLDLFGTSKLMGTATDPSSGGGLAAPLSSIAMNYVTGIGYIKTSAPNTGWSRIVDTAYAPGVYFSQGGNAFGAAGVLGTTDANRLDFVTGGVVGMSLGTTGDLTVTSANANSLAVGPAGSTNPVFQVDGSIASQATGIKITGAAAGGGVKIEAISSAANEDIILGAKGASGAVKLQVNGTNIYTATNYNHALTVNPVGTAATPRFLFTGGADTSLTVSTEAPAIYFNLGQTRQHATGTMSVQRDFRITPSTHSFVGASSLTSMYGFTVDGAPIAGANATVTNSSTIYSPGSAVGAGVTNSYGLNINANTGATNNYSAIFNGGSVGIGTSSPLSLLNLQGFNSSGAETVGLSLHNSTSTSTLPAYGFGMGPTGTEGYLTYRAGTTASAVFGHKWFVNDVEVMRVRGDGRLGIGTAAPSATLDVAGTSNVTSASTTAFTVGATGATNPALQVDSSTASVANGLKITGTAAGSGVKLESISTAANEDIILGTKGTSSSVKLQVGASNKYVATAQNHTFSVSATGTASTVRFGYTGAADTTLTASTEAPSTYFNLGQIRQHATGTMFLQRDFRITPSTHSFVGASTLSNMHGFTVDGAPIAGTNATVTNASAIYSPGNAVGSGVTNSYGLNINANTGATNNYSAIFNGGNVGIGTGFPSEKLQVASGEIMVSSNASTSSAVHNGIKFTTDNETYYSAVRANRDTLSTRIGLSFLTANGGVPVETMRIDYAGRVGIGTSSPAYPLDVQGVIQAKGTNNILLDPSTGYVYTNTGLVNLATGNNARMQVLAAGPYIERNIADANPALIVSNTNATSTGDITQFKSNATVKARITALGSVVVGNSTSAISTSATDGFLYVSSSAGAPTGTPTTQTGSVPVHVDATNNAMYMYTNSAWRSVAGSTVQGSRQTGTSMSVGTAITPALGSKTVAFVVGNGGAITITASPPITTTGMIVGQELKICGTSNTNTVTYNNSVNLVLNGSATLGKDQCLNLMYAGTDGTNLSWIETGRNF